MTHELQQSIFILKRTETQFNSELWENLSHAIDLYIANSIETQNSALKIVIATDEFWWSNYENPSIIMKSTAFK